MSKYDSTLIIFIIILIVLGVGYFVYKYFCPDGYKNCFTTITTPSDVINITAKDDIPSRDEVIDGLNEEVKKSMAELEKTATDAGIDPETLKDELFNANCALLPENDKCPEGFVLNDGCCGLYDDQREVARRDYNKGVKTMAFMISVTFLADFIITNLLPQLIKRGGYVGKLSARLLSKRGAKIAGKLTAKIVARMAVKMVSTMTTRIALYTAKIMVKLGSGPVGWALLVFDIISLTADLGDASNYNSLIYNKDLIKLRNKSVLKFWEAVRKEGMDLPCLFPLTYIFSETEIQTAQQVMVNSYGEELTQMVLSDNQGNADIIGKLFVQGFGNQKNKSSETDKEVEEIIGELGEPPVIEEQEMDKDLSAAYDKAYKKLRSENAQDMDKITFNQLISIGSGRTLEEKSKYVLDENDLELLPSFSSEDTIGISITKKAAEKWNKHYETEWFTYADFFKPVNFPTVDYSPPLYASYSDKYLTIPKTNPGTTSSPNVVYEKAKSPATFVYPFGPLFTMCEKERIPDISSRDSIDPRKHGVSFNGPTGVCEFTKDYCSRYGIDKEKKTDVTGLEYYDCKLSEGQKIAEFVVGTTLTRDSRQIWEKRIEDYKSGDPEKIAIATTLSVVDPTGLLQSTQTRRAENFKANQKKYGTGAAVGISFVDWTGQGQAFVEDMADKTKGRKKFCETGDTCKRFHAKSLGGHIMSWSVRNKEDSGTLYSRGQGFQSQVKHGEDHVFFIPDNRKWYFRVKCDPGEGKNFEYDELTNPFKVSCHFGQIDTSGKSGEELIKEGLITGANVAWDGARFVAITAWEGIEKGANVVWDGTKWVSKEIAGGTVKGANIAWDGTRWVAVETAGGIKKGANVVWDGSKWVSKEIADGTVKGANVVWTGSKWMVNKGVAGAEKGANVVWNGGKWVVNKTGEGLQNIFRR